MTSGSLSGVLLAFIRYSRETTANLVKRQQHEGPSLTDATDSFPASGSAAFALLEVLVASLILAVLVVSLYGAFSFGFTVIKQTQESVRADQILMEKLETLRSYNWIFVTNNSTSFTLTDQGTTFTGSLVITNAPVTESYSNSLRQATVTLSWLSGGISRSRSMGTFISENGVATYKP